MANQFSKQETVAFEEMLEGFTDQLTLSKAVSIYKTEGKTMERSNDIIWRPQPYVARSYPGTDMTSNFRDYVQLSVPASIGFSRSAPFILDAKQLRDGTQEDNIKNACKKRLASDINIAVMNVTNSLSSLVVKRSTTASGFDDIALAESVMNEQGVDFGDRYMFLNTRDYNAMASNLASRQNMVGKTSTAYESAYIGKVASFDTLKLDYSLRLLAHAAGTTTISGANQYYTPRATSTAVTGEVANVDNRFQNLVLNVATGTVRAGDCFTILGVNACHHITKLDTGQLKTFRIVSVVSTVGTVNTVQITPPIISGGGSTDAEIAYQNVTATPANGATVTFLNTVSTNINPFWSKDAIEILPAKYVIPSDSSVAVIQGSTDQGINVVMQKFQDINNLQTKYRVDVLFGVCHKQPEMAGIMLFNQI